MKKFTNTIRWIGTTVFLIMAVGTLSDSNFVGFLLFLLGASIIAPLDIISKIRKKLKLNKALSIILAIVLFFAGCSTLSNTEVSTNIDNNSQISETISDNSSFSSEDNSTSANKESSSENNTSKSEDVVSSKNDASSKESSSKLETTSSKEETTTKNNNSTEIVSSESVTSGVGSGKAVKINLSDIPTYSGNAYITINNNIPNFSADELTTTAYETYSDLDSLGRTQIALASVGIETMPVSNEERSSISHIKPSGWNQATYDNISGKYLYNRCHLIGWQLSAENDNKKNLITGTKYLNVNGMLPFENMVADYISETNNHVAYRITPIYEGNNLLASGIQMEAYSIEDNGAGICFNVYCYNVQPEITINYADGSSSGPSSSATSTPAVTSSQENTTSTTSLKEEITSETISQPDNTADNSNDNCNSTTYILNTNTKKFHESTCHHVKKISEENYSETNETRDEVIAKGYEPCGTCKP